MDDKGDIVGILASGQDITNLKLAQERALQSERLAAIGQMMAGLAHESRNALQRSQACLEMLATEVEDRPGAWKWSAAFNGPKRICTSCTKKSGNTPRRSN